MNEGVRAELEARGVPSELAGCLTDALEEEFPVDRLEELVDKAQDDPFSAFGPEDQESVVRLSQACGGPAALLGAGGASPGGPASAPQEGRGAYFDCVAEAGSSAEIKDCERR